MAHIVDKTPIPYDHPIWTEKHAVQPTETTNTFLAFYSGHMGGGKIVSIINDPEDHFKSTPIGSSAEAILKFACGFLSELPHTFPVTVFSWSNVGMRSMITEREK